MIVLAKLSRRPTRKVCLKRGQSFEKCTFCSVRKQEENHSTTPLRRKFRPVASRDLEEMMKDFLISSEATW